MKTHFLNKYLIYLLLLLSQTDPYRDTLPKQISDLPVTTTVTNLEPKCPSDDNLHGLGCWF
jgi:hypothetical protein